jgi:tRNA modification GTPase
LFHFYENCDMNFSRHNLQDTIVALATPSGVGAIGVIRLSGKEAIEIAGEVFQGKNLKEQKSHTVHFGAITDDDGRVIDEVLATVFVAPRSYTGEDVVEVSCHGSPYIIQELLQLFIGKGARLGPARRVHPARFLNGRMDLSQAEAVADLIAAESRTQHDLALKQMRGGFSTRYAICASS